MSRFLGCQKHANTRSRQCAHEDAVEAVLIESGVQNAQRLGQPVCTEIAIMRWELLLGALASTVADVPCNAAPIPETCSAPIDFIVILDMSSSIASEFENVVDFTETFIELFTLEATGPRIAIIGYNEEDFLIANFSTNATALSDAVNAAVVGGASSQTDDAFRGAAALFASNRRDISVQRQLLLLTDSKSQDHEQAITDAGSLQDDGVRMFAVYWGPGGFQAFTVMEYVSPPSSDYFIQASSVTDSIGKLVEVVDKGCTVVHYGCARMSECSEQIDVRAAPARTACICPCPQRRHPAPLTVLIARSWWWSGAASPATSSCAAACGRAAARST